MQGGLNGIESITGSIGIPETILQPTIDKIQPQQADKIEFKNLLNMAMNALNNSQVDADTAMQQLAAGQNIELHNVMLAAEKASLTLQLALQVKNKITEAYQQLMNMQI